MPHPSELEPPVWSPGDSWHYVDGSGQWQNWTVESLQERNGYETYRVRIDAGDPERRTFNQTFWIDARTLGIVEFGFDDERRRWNTVIDPPAKQLFPMVDRTYNITWTYPHDTFEQRVEYTIGSVARIDVPAGRFDAVFVDSFDHESGFSVVQGWYSPEVGFYVSFGLFEPFKLVQWTDEA